ncbi:MAG: metallophosphoesterase [Eubacteriales bacterium]
MQRNTKKINKKVLIALLLLSLFAFDVRLKVVQHTFETPKVDSPICIALVADLHGCYYGKQQKTLINAINDANPDVILLAGDLFDDGISYQNAEIFLAGIAEYPTYYVTGNHEYWSHEVEVILDIVESYGVAILDGEQDLFEINGEAIAIAGISDPDKALCTQDKTPFSDELAELGGNINEELYTILLSHRPERIEEYLQYPFDLALSGHAHGGQWRIPFHINGVFAPNQGIFPQYAGGLYQFEDMNFIVSRGLARESTLVPRIFNRPELIFIQLT